MTYIVETKPTRCPSCRKGLFREILGSQTTEIMGGFLFIFFIKGDCFKLFSFTIYNSVDLSLILILNIFYGAFIQQTVLSIYASGKIRKGKLPTEVNLKSMGKE